MPATRNAAAPPNAQKNECVIDAMYPVTIGAEIAESWLPKFIIPPTVPTLSRGAISDGTDQATGAAADNPPIARLIQMRAVVALCAYAAPSIPKPRVVPPMRIAWRTREASRPRWTNLSTSQPPIRTSVIVAMIHGTLVYKAE